jgi:hypothetical protein
MPDHHDATDETEWLLHLLHTTHPGLSEQSAGALCASACVCLYRHHISPTRIKVYVDQDPFSPMITWKNPTQRDHNSNANRLDATRDGAYAVALICLERKLNLVTVGRAEELTGADWYVAPPGKGTTEMGAPNLDDPSVTRLEVGGHDDRSSLPYELKEKVKQLERGDANRPGIAAVVGFKKACVLIQTNVLPDHALI